VSDMEKVYWRFANERLRMYHRRLKGKESLTKDSILRDHRFTNAYRASDRVSQYLIREVQYGEEERKKELFFRTLLFKIFNKIETWQMIQGHFDEPITSHDLKHIRKLLVKHGGKGLYSAAYIQASPAGKGVSKAIAHIDLLTALMDLPLWKNVRDARSLEEVFLHMRSIRSFGDFLAYQYTIDLNYSTMIDFDENDFVVPGPGALDGISKIMPGTHPVKAIRHMTKRARDEMGDTLFGRQLHLIDCQNLFCEISKYTRVSHPTIQGVSGRTTIKQNYTPHSEPLPRPFFPPKWNLEY